MRSANLRLAFLALFAALARAGPRQSWATVGDRAFFHSSVLNTLAFAPADAALIARFPLVTIEKWQGCNSTPGCYGAAAPAAACPTQQDATLAAARALKALAPTVFISAWLDSLRIYEPVPRLNPDFIDASWQRCVRPAGSAFLDAHAAYLLPNASGAPALESYIHAHVFDHRAAAVRDFWRETCENLTRTGLVDGCGADASQQPGAYIGGLAPGVGDAWQRGRDWTVGNTTAALAPRGGVVLGKVGAQLGVTTNGVLQEGCDAGNATVGALRAAAAASRRDGVVYVYMCHSTGSEDDLAAFLVGAYEGAFWGFGGWVQRGEGFADRWLPVFDRPLGAPAADARYDAPTQTWARDFAAARVTFDAATKKGTITFK